jgi:hypothetical protein
MFPSVNITVPVGMTPFPVVAVTLAVKVTDCPKLPGFGRPVSCVADVPFPTLWLRTGDDAEE